MSQQLRGVSGRKQARNLTVFTRNHINCKHRLKSSRRAKPQNSIPRPQLVVHGIKTDKTKRGPLSSGRPKGPHNARTPTPFPPSSNTTQQLLRRRQRAARHLVHRLPLAGRSSSPEGPQPIPLLPHDAAEGEVPLKGQDGREHLLRLTQGVGRAGGRTVGELREERREVAQWAAGTLLCSSR